jgi:co-chaperonin GroES (HSP10)
MELLNFAAPKEEINVTQAVVTKKIAKDYQYKPMPNAILVLKPEVTKTTKGGIQKSDSQIAEELKKMDYPMAVLATSPEAEAMGIKANSKVVVMRFTATNLPSPIEGFDVVFVRTVEVLAYDKTALTV